MCWSNTETQNSGIVLTETSKTLIDKWSKGSTKLHCPRSETPWTNYETLMPLWKYGSYWEYLLNKRWRKDHCECDHRQVVVTVKHTITLFFELTSAQFFFFPSVTVSDTALLAQAPSFWVSIKHKCDGMGTTQLYYFIICSGMEFLYNEELVERHWTKAHANKGRIWLDETALKVRWGWLRGSGTVGKVVVIKKKIIIYTLIKNLQWIPVAHTPSKDFAIIVRSPARMVSPTPSVRGYGRAYGRGGAR